MINFSWGKSINQKGWGGGKNMNSNLIPMHPCKITILRIKNFCEIWILRKYEIWLKTDLSDSCFSLFINYQSIYLNISCFSLFINYQSIYLNFSCFSLFINYQYIYLNISCFSLFINLSIYLSIYLLFQFIHKLINLSIYISLFSVYS